MYIKSGFPEIITVKYVNVINVYVSVSQEKCVLENSGDLATKIILKILHKTLVPLYKCLLGFI